MCAYQRDGGDDAVEHGERVEDAVLPQRRLVDVAPPVDGAVEHRGRRGRRARGLHRQHPPHRQGNRPTHRRGQGADATRRRRRLRRGGRRIGPRRRGGASRRGVGRIDLDSGFGFVRVEEGRRSPEARARRREGSSPGPPGPRVACARGEAGDAHRGGDRIAGMRGQDTCAGPGRASVGQVHGAAGEEASGRRMDRAQGAGRGMRRSRPARRD